MQLCPGPNVADPGSGAFLTPRSGMGKKIWIRIRDDILDHISDGFETIFGIKILKFFDADPDPGSGIFLTLDPGSGMEKFQIRNKHPGSATLVLPYGNLQSLSSVNARHFLQIEFYTPTALPDKLSHFPL